MNDFLTDIKTFVANAEHLFIATIFSIVNALVRPPQASFGRYVMEFIISVIVATFVGYICSQNGASKSLTHTFVAISALLARDSLEFVIGFGDYLKKKRTTVYEALLDRLTGHVETDKKEGKEKENGKR
jgi:prenyltransferase beta subunit